MNCVLLSERIECLGGEQEGDAFEIDDAPLGGDALLGRATRICEQRDRSPAPRWTSIEIESIVRRMPNATVDDCVDARCDVEIGSLVRQAGCG